MSDAREVVNETPVDEGGVHPPTDALSPAEVPQASKNTSPPAELPAPEVIPNP